jgi:hypothetical protein
LARLARRRLISPQTSLQGEGEKGGRGFRGGIGWWFIIFSWGVLGKKMVGGKAKKGITSNKLLILWVLLLKNGIGVRLAYAYEGNFFLGMPKRKIVLRAGSVNFRGCVKIFWTFVFFGLEW